MQYRMLMLLGILSGFALGGCILTPTEDDPSAETAASNAPTAGETSAATTAPDATTNNLDVHPHHACPLLPPGCCVFSTASGCLVCDLVCDT